MRQTGVAVFPGPQSSPDSRDRPTGTVVTLWEYLIDRRRPDGVTPPPDPPLHGRGERRPACARHHRNFLPAGKEVQTCNSASTHVFLARSRGCSENKGASRKTLSLTRRRKFPVELSVKGEHVVSGLSELWRKGKREIGTVHVQNSRFHFMNVLLSTFATNHILV